MMLIIGYGNPLRSDDAIGQRLAQMMEQRLKPEVVQVITAYQLTYAGIGRTDPRCSVGDFH